MIERKQRVEVVAQSITTNIISEFSSEKVGEISGFGVGVAVDGEITWQQVVYPIFTLPLGFGLKIPRPGFERRIKMAREKANRIATAIKST